ncbi:MAG TPA: glycoside hydrolase family 13 protein [Ktedonosporobacter sp.]|nr:glycoside hydrolase family 13 protein [Ktedonosporobacter sp.]
MAKVVDFFFAPYPSAQTRRLHAALEDGLAHGSRIEPHDPQPDTPVTLIFSTDGHKPVEQVAVYYTTDGSTPAGERGNAIHGMVVQAPAEERLVDEEQHLAIQQWRAVLPAQPDGTVVRYRADGWSISEPERHWYADNVDPVGIPPHNGRLFAYHVDNWTTPEWWQDAIVYQIFVDRFSAAHDEPALLSHDERAITGFFGGTLNGIREKLDYLQDLGVNCLWLSPIFESPTHHGYNASDYHNVARRYGGNEALHRLIQEAHQRGMRVLLDFVANHTSNEHPSFIAARNDPHSATAQWYDFIPGSPHYRSYAAVQDMPELKTEHPEVQKYLFEAAQYWLEHFGADGLRLDYVPGPSHAFWALFQQAIKEHFPEALTIGEITGPLADIADYAGRMDAFMDFPLAKMLRDTFAQRTTSLAALLTYLDARQPELPATMTRGTLLDNHDSHRFLWLADGDVERLKLAAACHMTLEGTPIIYYGTEVGLSQYQDAHKENAYARAPMLWDTQQDHDLLAHYRRLIELRQSYPALRTGARTPVALTVIDGSQGDKQHIGAYLRHQDGYYLLIVLNNSESSIKIRIDLAEALIQTGSTHQPPSGLQNLLATTAMPRLSIQDGWIELEMAPLTAAIYNGVSA